MPDKKDVKQNPKGKEDRSVAHEMDHQQDKTYPRPNEKDRQFDNQPEFNEKESSRKDEEVT
jgi:hypothetical protein